MPCGQGWLSPAWATYLHLPNPGPCCCTPGIFTRGRLQGPQKHQERASPDAKALLQPMRVTRPSPESVWEGDYSRGKMQGAVRKLRATTAPQLVHVQRTSVTAQGR